MPDQPIKKTSDAAAILSIKAPSLLARLREDRPAWARKVSNRWQWDGVAADALKTWWYAISYPEDIPALSHLSTQGVRLVYANRGGLGWYVITKDADVSVPDGQQKRMLRLGYIQSVKPDLPWTLDNFVITDYGRKTLVALQECAKCRKKR